MKRDKSGRFAPTKYTPEEIEGFKQDIKFMLDNGSYSEDEIRIILFNKHGLSLAYSGILLNQVKKGK